MSGGIPLSQMRFCGEPTADGDIAAEYLRAWYEANRESWWDRRNKPWEMFADNFMLGLMNEVYRIESEKLRQRSETAKRGL